ncbi:hypothetical protein ABE437_00775 [Isoptericola cucumis]|uniref:hypothetical protein n=1 Tax=Isoptericola cucumis TaxID=1776856 RepID=UPI003208563B
MTGRNPPQDSTHDDPVVARGRNQKNGWRTRGSLAGLVAAACGATLALGGPATARPVEDEEREGPRFVLDGRASLDPGELGEGGWSIVTDMPDRVVFVAGPARVRIVVDATLGATAGNPGRGVLVAALSRTAGLAPATYVTRPAGVFVAFDADPPASDCTALPWQQTRPTGPTLTGEGDAKVLLGTPCTVERAYVVTRGPGNLLIEAQAPQGTDGGQSSMDSMDALVMTLVPTGAHIDDNLSPLDYVHR